MRAVVETAIEGVNNALARYETIKKYDVLLLKIIRHDQEITSNINNVKIRKSDVLIMQINIKDIIKFKND